MGGDPTYGPNPGDFPPQGGNKDVGDENAEKDGWEMRIPPYRRCPTDAGDGDSGYLHLHTPE